ncbi:MAG: 6,7-dimethyl-8-ribityllumazine synthase [Acidimicrobiales bacterium]|nr:6,7-dimethyl-8-ribityllumazine synthase [Acidimicrobiales bacterium]
MTGEADKAAPAAGLDGTGLRIGVVRARWNPHIVERLAEGVRRGLEQLGVADTDVVEVGVPGSFELPMGARILASSGQVDAVICLGSVIRGETTHYELVAGESAAGIQQVQLTTGVPVAFGVLTTEDEEQALARSQGPGGHNVGEDSAIVAVEMARLAATHPPA